MKFSGGQLWAVLFTFRVFTFICSQEAYSLHRIGGTALSVFVQLLVVIPLIRKLRKNPGLSDSGKWDVLPALYFIFTGMLTFGRLIDISEAENFLRFSGVVPVVLFAVAVFYCSRLGIRAAGRAAVVISGIFVFFLLLLMITSVPEMRVDNVMASYDDTSFIGYFVKDIAESGELAALIWFVMYTEGRRERSVYIYFASKILLVGLVSLLGTAVSGRVSVLAGYPFFELTSFSDIFGVQRSDVLFITTCTLSAVLTASVCVTAASEILEKYFGCTKLVCLAFITLGGIVMRGGNANEAALFLVPVFTFISVFYVLSAASAKRKAGSV
jgi:hypothetical protein